jgi:Protein of unknown function (DUF3309)
VGTILVILLVLLLLGGLPQISGSWHNYGYAPSGVLMVVVLVLIVLLLTGRL